MAYFLFNYDDHHHLIPSFLEAAANAYGNPVLCKEWFSWKYTANPYGDPIIYCAVDNDEIVGWVSYGRQNFLINKEVYHGAMSFDTFVAPSHQGQGIFSKLVKLVEAELKEQNIAFAINFPNSNSLPGFLKRNWKQLDIVEYWVKPKNIVAMPKIVKNIRNTFVPLASNYEEIKKAIPSNFNQNPVGTLESQVTYDYLKWRFFTHPNAAYIVIDNEYLFSIARIGKRGAMQEIQIILVHWKLNEKSISRLIRDYKKKVAFDLIGFSISKNNPLRKELKKQLFIKVPTQVNVCYKIFNESLNIDVSTISLSAINYHTY